MKTRLLSLLLSASTLLAAYGAVFDWAKTWADGH